MVKFERKTLMRSIPYRHAEAMHCRQAFNFHLEPVYKVYIGWFVPAKGPMYITFEARFPHKVKCTRGKFDDSK